MVERGRKSITTADVKNYYRSGKGVAVFGEQLVVQQPPPSSILVWVRGGESAEREPMSQALCPYCGASEGRCVVVGGGRFLTECRSCGRVVEERLSEVDELFIERAHDAPLCIVTPDFSENESYRAPPIEDDPFESIGFITAFSTWSLEQCPLFTATSTSFSGQLAEMERVLSDSLYSAGTTATSLAGASMSTVDTLRAYFQIVEVSSVLGLERDSCDHAIQLFRDCLSTTYLRNRNIEALATAALVQAIREQQEPRTLQEISAAANIPQKEIARHIKVLSDALKLSQPINSNSISVHMPRFCNLLQLSKTTQDLATHIGEVVINKSFCTRRNPISISAAAIYLSCQLEDKRKTQTEICKATGLTEVTLRKVYKELLENLDDLLPPNYKPAVPLEKAFPVIGTALGRVHVARAAAGVAMSDPSIPGTPYNSAVTNNSAGLGGDTSSVVGGSGGNSPGQPNMVRVPVSGVSATDRATAGAHFQGSTPPSSDGRPGVPLFNGPHLGSGAMAGGVEAVENRTRLDSSKEMERDRSQREREKERERDNGMDIDYPPPKKLNMMPPASVPQGFRPSFFPFAQVDPRMFQDMNTGMWPVHLYGAPAMRPEEGTTSARGSDRAREDGGGNPALPNSKQPPQQYVSFVPGVPDGLSPNMQVKMLQLMQQRRPPEAVERQGGAFERENREPERDRDHEGDAGDNGNHPVPVPTTNPAATLQAYATAAAASGRQGPPVFAGIPQGLWPFLTAGGPVPYGMYPPQLIQTQGGLPQGVRQGGENHTAGVSEKSLEGLPQGLLNSAGAETLARMAGSGGVPGQAGRLGGQPNHLPMPWPGAPFHPLFLPSNMNVGPGPAGGMSNGMIISEGSNGMKREGGSGGDGNGRMTASGVSMNLSQRPGTDMFLTMAGNHGSQGPPGHPPSTSQQRPDNGEATTTSVAMTNQQPSFERQQMQHGQR